MIGFIKGWKLRTKIIVGVVVFLVGFYVIFGGDYRASRKNGGTNTSEVTDNTETTEEPTEELSDEESEQQAYIKAWGEPPEGYKWNDDKELVPISDSSLSPEDVLYGYSKGCAMLDFATAGRYAKNSSVISQYENYYSQDVEYDERLDFMRKVYKRVLEVTNIEEILDTATFSDGTLVYTVKVSTIDLSNKDFWLNEKEQLFMDMYSQRHDKKDDLQARKYVYDKIVEYYNSDSVQMVEKNIEIKLAPSDGSYFVTDDSSLKALCTYSEGEQVVDYIFEQYSVWRDEYLKQLEIEAEKQQQEAEKKASKKNK